MVTSNPANPGYPEFEPPGALRPFMADGSNVDEKALDRLLDAIHNEPHAGSELPRRTPRAALAAIEAAAAVEPDGAVDGTTPDAVAEVSVPKPYAPSSLAGLASFTSPRHAMPAPTPPADTIPSLVRLDGYEEAANRLASAAAGLLYALTLGFTTVAENNLAEALAAFSAVSR